LLLFGVLACNDPRESNVTVKPLDVSNDVAATASTDVVDARGLMVQPGTNRILVDVIVSDRSARHTERALVAYDVSGEIDATFGDKGLLRLHADETAKTAIDPEGDIVLQYASASGIGLRRYDASGRLDPAFGDHGEVETSMGEGARPRGAAFASDRGVIAYGRTLGQSGVQIERYTADGHPDPAATDLKIRGCGDDGAIVRAPAMSLFLGDQLVLGGAGPGGFDVARFGREGDRDPFFGDDGRATVPGDEISIARGTIDGEKRLLFAGLSSRDCPAIAVARLTAGGRPDRAFGATGYARICDDKRRTIDAIAADERGRLVVAAHTPSGVVSLLRLDEDGRRDRAFASGGYENVAFTDGAGRTIALATMSDGSVLQLGETTVGSTTHVTLGRFLEDGAWDPGFAAARFRRQ
jgi:uncharacterized delta-60 repeat protein